MRFRVVLTYLFSLILLAGLTGCVGGGEALITNLPSTSSTATAIETATPSATPTPSLSSSAASLTFSILKGQTTAAQSVTITNSGGPNSTTCNTSITGAGSAAFTISANTCAGATLASAGTCSVSITSTPALATSYTGQLDVECGGVTKSVTLSSTGESFVVSTFSPSNGSTGNDSNSQIELTFSHALNTTSFNRGMIELTEIYSHLPIPYTYSYNAGAKTLTLTPLRYVTSPNKFQVKAKTTLTSSTGSVALEAEQIISFAVDAVSQTVHGRATTSAAPVLKGLCSRNVTSITATLDGAGTALSDSDCSDGTWAATVNLASNDTDYSFVLTATAGAGVTSSKTVRLRSCSSLAAIVADSTYASGTGISTDPYMITSVEELAGMASNLSASYKLAQDIDLTCKSWTPIGTLASPFTGNFDGGTFYIKNLTIEAPGADYQGLFGVVSAGTISNVTMYDAYVDGNGRAYVGALIGQIQNGATLDEINVSGVVSTGSNLGGVVGRAYDGAYIYDVVADVVVSGGGSLGGIVGGVATSGTTSSTLARLFSYAYVIGSGTTGIGGVVGSTTYVDLKNTRSTGELTSSINMVGGIIGSTTGNSVLRYCKSTMNLTASSTATGGIIGKKVGGILQYCHYNGTINSSSSAVGGIVGYSTQNSTTISDSIAEGTYSGSNFIGGIVGQTDNIPNNILRNITWATISSAGATQGKAFAEPDPAAGKSNYFLDTACAVAPPTGCPQNNAIGLAATYLKQENTFYSDANAWVLAPNSEWSIDEGNNYPQLDVVKCLGRFKSVTSATSFSGGSGTPGSPYQITSYDQVPLIANNLSASYILMNNIDVIDNCYLHTPIGSNASPFTGTLDGQGYSLKGLWMEAATSYHGFFGATSGATISDLTISGRMERTASTPNYRGILTGDSVNTDYSNITVYGSLFSYDNFNMSYHGLLTGRLDSNSTATDIVVKGRVQERFYMGGAVGTCDGTITNVSATTVMMGSYVVGGVCGRITTTGVASRLSFRGYINASGDYAGGVVGSISGDLDRASSVGVIVGGPATPKQGYGGVVGLLNVAASLTNCYAQATVSGYQYVGGIAGKSLNAANVVNKCYSASTTSGSLNVEKGIAFLTGGETITNSFILDTACATPINGATGAGGCPEASSGVIGITDAEMKALSTYNNFFGWDFTTNWSIVNGTSYPTLQ